MALTLPLDDPGRERRGGGRLARRDPGSDPRGELLHASTHRFEGSIASEVRYGREPADYRVVATLHPGLAQLIRERPVVTRAS